MDSEFLLRNYLKDIDKHNGIAGLTLEANGSASIEVNDGRKIFI